MQRFSILSMCAPLLGLALAACDSQNSQTSPPDMSGPLEHSLVPLPGMEDAVPELTSSVKVVLETTGGDVTIEVYAEAAPNAAQRFIELVESDVPSRPPAK